MTRIIICAAFLYLLMMCFAKYTFSQITTQQFSYEAGKKTWGKIYQPSDRSKKYPTIIFFHNATEAGTTAGSSDKLLIFGPLREVTLGFRPDYNIIALQYNSWSMPAALMKQALSFDTLLKSVVDTNNVVLIGIGSGASVISDWLALGYSTRGIIPLSPLGLTTFAPKMIPMWGFYENMDKSAARPSIYKLKELLGGGRVTVYPGNHCCFNTATSRNYKEDGKSIYDFIDSISIRPDAPVYKILNARIQYSDANGFVKIDEHAKVIVDSNAIGEFVIEYRLSTGEVIKEGSKYVWVYEFTDPIPQEVLDAIKENDAEDN